MGENIAGEEPLWMLRWSAVAKMMIMIQGGDDDGVLCLLEGIILARFH